MPAIELEGYEADDVIATYARQVSRAGGEVVIVSSDKDLMQLVDEQTCLLDPVKQVKICRAEVIEKFGVPPEKVIEVQALAGDSVDNVPGAPGIGIKTAAQLLTEYGDLDTLLERAHEIKQPKRRETLINFADQVRISRQLVTLADDAPVPDAGVRLVVRAPDPKVLADFLDQMMFKTLALRVAHIGRPPRRMRAASRNGPAKAPRPGKVEVEIDPAKHLCLHPGPGRGAGRLVIGRRHGRRPVIGISTPRRTPLCWGDERLCSGSPCQMAPGQKRSTCRSTHCRVGEGLALAECEHWDPGRARRTAHRPTETAPGRPLGAEGRRTTSSTTWRS